MRRAALTVTSSGSPGPTPTPYRRPSLHLLADARRSRAGPHSMIGDLAARSQDLLLDASALSAAAVIADPPRRPWTTRCWQVGRRQRLLRLRRPDEPHRDAERPRPAAARRRPACRAGGTAPSGRCRSRRPRRRAGRATARARRRCGWCRAGRERGDPRVAQGADDVVARRQPGAGDARGDHLRRRRGSARRSAAPSGPPRRRRGRSRGRRRGRPARRRGSSGRRPGRRPAAGP